MLTLATPRRRNPDSNSSAAPTATAPAETTADPSTAAPARRVAEALDKAVEGLEAAFENASRIYGLGGCGPDGGEESSPKMANNMAMTPEDKAELARLDAEQVEDDAEVIQIAVERTQYAQQGVGWQERKVQMP